MEPLSPPIQVLLLLTAMFAAGLDWRYRRIPNLLTLGAWIGGVAVNTARAGWAGCEFALLGTALALAIYLPLFALRGMGAGDVKLMAALGAMAGPVDWLAIFLGAALIGGVAAVVLALRRGRLQDTLLNVSILAGDLIHLRAPYREHPALDVRRSDTLRLPHGVSIGAGAAVAVLLLSWRPF